jgi:hypothetical protein
MWLGYSDEEIWDLRPRKFYALLKARKVLNSCTVSRSAEPVQEGFIDQIPGW